MFDDPIAVDIQRSIHGLHLNHVHDAVSQYTRVCSYCTDIIHERDAKIKIITAIVIVALAKIFIIQWYHSYVIKQ